MSKKTSNVTGFQTIQYFVPIATFPLNIELDITRKMICYKIQFDAEIN